MSDVRRVSLSSLPTLGEMNAKPRAVPKGASRLEEKTASAKDDAKALDAFRKAVIARDGKKCRKCGRKVVETRELLPNRLEVHHCHGRIGKFRHDPRMALVLCASDHQRVTGRVNDRLFIVQKASLMLTLDGKSYINAANAVEFTEAK